MNDLSMPEDVLPNPSLSRAEIVVMGCYALFIATILTISLWSGIILVCGIESDGGPLATIARFCGIERLMPPQQ